ncbi:hypothetical protein JNJ66_00915 [Candidatus Saccharibacteria bacterium]|nr:hypothetical protein [Candidatus Saccharibacteria bacterium]
MEAEDRLSLLATDQFLIALGWLPQIVSGTTPDLTANVWMLTHLIVGGDHLQFHGAGTPPTLLRYTGGDWNGGGREQFMTTEPYVVDPGLPGWFIRYDGGHGGPADGRGGVDVPYFWHNPDPTLGYERDGALYLPRLHARTVYERLSSQLFQQVAPLIVAQRGCNPA